ncbi:histidine phosphatase family protein [Aspergillus niger CBS 101883]|uniref:histidine phosphatase family protein n=1 Tax=Aspergillus lacticoffeatus (strain CBS 101883) TaxID=1450533 RepID=UPI000D803A13|nr:phosphoglycerate mutase-like protein [Aspergillus niger CBS 101883]PYH51641.1 phosphoglycerate mutase-like protein [Aspergillus niger CBS 101883]
MRSRIYWAILFLLLVSCVSANDQYVMGVAPTTTEPEWFKTRPQSFQGYTATGAAPFLAQTNPAPFGNPATYTANHPLETSQPIRGGKDRNIFHHMGILSPYYPRADGFGVDEFPRPKGSNITQMHMLHRHGSRYPNKDEAHGAVFKDELSFIHDWTYSLGADMLTTRGREDLLESGILNFYNYGHLYTPGTKIVARTTTQDRMLKSAENFLAGFFHLDWDEHVNLLAMIEEKNFNSSLQAKNACPNAMKISFDDYVSDTVTKWKTHYLSHRTHHLNYLSTDYHWTSNDSFNAQTLCAYETVALGYSPWCSLFTFPEWEGFSYTYDLTFGGNAGFQCPISRAMGITWVQEFLARVENRSFSTPGSSSAANLTLNTNPVTFPTNQSLYFDFAHDKILLGVLTAFGLRQFADLPFPDYTDQYFMDVFPPRHHAFQTAKLIPFAGRLNIEIIRAPHKINPRRSHHDRHQDTYMKHTAETEYVHFLLNQRTVPLHKSLPECSFRSDGWCELDAFLRAQKDSLRKAEYDFSCVGEWDLGEFGDVWDGVPVLRGE